MERGCMSTIERKTMKRIAVYPVLVKWKTDGGVASPRVRGRLPRFRPDGYRDLWTLTVNGWLLCIM
jgi:hypothetical protein